MGIVLGTNIASRQATRRLDEANSILDRSLMRLSTGSRINRASDDAAGLSIASALRSGQRVFGQAIRNGNDALSALNIAQGSLQELSTVVTRLKELAEQAANGTLSRTQRTALDQEGYALTKEFNRITSSTKFNDLNLLDPSLGQVFAQLGYGTNGSIAFDPASGLRRTVGTGSFGSANSGVSGVTSGGVTGDFNGDGNLDIVGIAAVSSNATIALGNGDGTFKAGTTIALGSNGRTIASGDFNGDGKLDIVIGNNPNAQIFLGDGNGGFGAATTISAAAVTTLKVADVDGDGKSDLITGDTASISVFRGSGTGSFIRIGSFSNSATLKSLEIGDFNGDGSVDFATSATTDSSIRIFVGNHSGGFSLSSTVTASASNGGISVSDINRDGLADIVTTSGDVFTSTGNGTDFTSKTSPTFDSPNGYLTLTDVNGDGLIDILRAGTSFYETLLGNGDGSFGSAIQTSRVASTPGMLSSGDFNNDGVLDVYVSATELRLGSTDFATTIEHMSLVTVDGALSALTKLDAYLQRISTGLGNLGSSMSRISTAIANLEATKENYAAAAGRIEDADVASESSQLVRSRILRESAAAVLAQANLQPELALSLLK